MRVVETGSLARGHVWKGRSLWHQRPIPTTDFSFIQSAKILVGILDSENIMLEIGGFCPFSAFLSGVWLE
jgi:hypothetical protein